MDLMGNCLILLKKVLMETQNGGRLRTTTREQIKQQIYAMEKDKEFITELFEKR